MLAKSKKSAAILSGIIVISFSVVNALENILIPYWVTGNIQTIVNRPEALQSPQDFFSLGIILAVLLLLMILIGSYWLYRFFGERYFGLRGAARWALFGIFFAIFMMLPEWLLPNGWRLLINLLKFSSVFVAFFVSRRIIPLKKG